MTSLSTDPTFQSQRQFLVGNEEWSGRLRPFTYILAFLLWFSAIQLAGQSLGPTTEQLRETLRGRLELAGNPPTLLVEGELLTASVTLPLFYERRGFLPAWSDARGPLPALDSLIVAIEAAAGEGLDPTDYHLLRLMRSRELLAASDSSDITNLLADLDLLASDAFLVYGTHLLSGRINPQTFDAEWHAQPRGRDMAALLDTALTQNSVRASLENLLPPQRGYADLRRALQSYRELAAAGGWSTVTKGPTLAVGDSGERVVALRQRLRITGDLPEGPTTDSLFDSLLAIGVENFQLRHGLEADGKVGPKTLEEMNVPIAKRIRQIRNNLERWRWLPQDLGSKHVLVNIAAFDLEASKPSAAALEMRAIVGKNYRRTPVFSDRISYLVFNPSWNVPRNIAVQDILPQIKKDPGYLTAQGIELLRNEGGNWEPVDPMAVDWSSTSTRSFNFSLRQRPGPQNALGLFKFMFPNEFNVYLHDTPSRGLFAKTSRDFSSGCVRIEKPFALAEFLLEPDSSWSRERIERELATGKEHTVSLPQTVPIHLLYFTAWADTSGIVHFRSDIYGRDSLLNQALMQDPAVD